MVLNYWLPVAAAVFLICMMLYGHYRGFLRQCVSLGALLLTVIIVKVMAPYVTGFIRDTPVVRETVAQIVLDASGWTAPLLEDGELPAAQRISIEAMELPQYVKDTLLENNNNEIYQLLGVEEFADYIGTYLADMLINAVSSVLLFILCFLVIHLIIKWLDLIARLPILSGLNQIAGAVLGLAQGLLILWVAGFVVSVFSSTPTGQMLEEQIYSSRWLTFIYQYNLIRILLIGIIKGVF